MTERLHFHFSLSCIGEGNGNPLQCSCLENPRVGGAWWAAVSGVAQSRTRLKRLSRSSRPPELPNSTTGLTSSPPSLPAPMPPTPPTLPNLPPLPHQKTPSSSDSMSHWPVVYPFRCQPAELEVPAATHQALPFTCHGSRT